MPISQPMTVVRGNTLENYVHSPNYTCRRFLVKYWGGALQKLRDPNVNIGLKLVHNIKIKYN